jgi:flavin-dependent dehydrogenase
MVQALVIGGGLAGSAVAIRLALEGRQVVLVEREALPVDKVCGEFLSREAALYLAALGVDLPALGAVPIRTLRLCEREHVATVRLPFAATSLSRRVLDEALLTRATLAGAQVRRGAKVNQLVAADGGYSARMDDGTHVDARQVFLATGKHDLRGHKRPSGLQDDLVAFKLHLRLSSSQTADLEQHVELVLFNGGYAGLQPIEEARANLCLVVRRKRLQESGGRWETLLAELRAESSHLDARLAGAEPCWAKPLALSAIPYGYVRRRSDGLWRLGDQAAVIPSFSGDGMSIALHSAELAAATYLAGRSANVYQQRLARDVTAQVLLATALSQGLVRGLAQAALTGIARVSPRLMATVAFHTRVSDAALARLSRSRARA